MNATHSVRAARTALAGSIALFGCAGVASPPRTPYDSQGCAEDALRRRPDPALLREAAAIVPPACADQDARACSILGVMSEVGAGVSRDRGRARWLYRRACDAGNMNGCGNLGELLLADLEPGADQGVALALLQRSCDAGKIHACDVVLGHACTRGEQSACLALADLRTACARGSEPACGRIERLPPEVWARSLDAAGAVSPSVVARGR